MKMRKFVKSVTGLFLIFSVILCVVIGFYYVNLPDKYYLSDNESFKFNTFFNISGEKATQKDGIQAAYANNGAEQKDKQQQEVELKLLGIFPIKSVKAEQIERPRLVPCGTPFGIKILTQGAVVTELGEVDGENGLISPAHQAGIKVGDVIIEINGVEITQNSDISTALNHPNVNSNEEKAEEATVIYTRDGQKSEIMVTPAKSKQDGMYKMGAWVRDSSAGIGTMTYYNPADATFGGLGHAVCDVDTGQIMPLSSGEVVSVQISGVVKGFAGAPGELSGSFLSRIPIGAIKTNCESGVYGIMESPPVLDGEVEMAYKQEVKIGPAKIITTIDGNSPAEYDVLIEKIDYNDKNAIKNMVIKVTDKTLLNKTGGIVQGMSGSPIIQNGRLAGAVTHVFVNDPTRGYAIFAENMYRESLQIAQTDRHTIHEIELLEAA
ncbi:MAG: SpoIVB peptidase [Oscillospiraceae bacterium]|nr:SpoIVB peptidase [Oscillospiraceae bacterium]